MGALVHDRLTAAVFFYRTSEHWSRRFLAADFKHVDVVLRTQGADLWVAAVGKVGGLIAPLALVDFDPEVYAEAVGAKVVLLPAFQPKARRLPLMTSTCVGVAKAVLGVTEPFIITPKQLFTFLTKGRP